MQQKTQLVLLIVILILTFNMQTFASVAKQEEFVVITSAKACGYFINAVELEKCDIFANKFGQSFFVLDDKTNEKLLELPEGHVWVKKEFLIGNERNGRVEENYIQAKKDKNDIYIKSLIRNTNAKNSIAIPYFADPDLTIKLGDIDLFDVRYIFDQKNKASLLARHQNIRKSNSERVIQGWVANQDFRSWNTKLGVEFNKKTYSHRYKNTDENCKLAKIYNDKWIKKDDPAYFSEQASSQSLKHYDIRYPLLRTLPVKKEPENQLLELFYIGSTSAYSGKTYTSQDIAKFKNEVKQSLKDDVEIMILLDATKGMNKHFLNTKIALEKFIRNLTNKTRIGLAVYRDYPDGDNVYELMQQLTTDHSTIITALNQIKIYSSSGDSKGAWSYPEALFQGIVNTAQKTRWLNKAEKSILLVGDHGNHELFDVYKNKPGHQVFNQDKKYNPVMVGQILEQMQITLQPIQVHSNDIAKKQYSDMFEKQINRVLDNSGVVSANLIKVKSNSTAAIFNAFDSLYLNKLTQKGELVRVLNGQVEKGNFYTRALLERMGIPPDALLAPQLTSLGYAKQINDCGLEQFETRVLLQKTMISKLDIQINNLHEAILYWDPDSPQQFERTIKELVKALTGDQLDPEESIADFIEKRSGIPIRTQLLHQSLSELLTSFNGMSEEEKEGHLKHLNRSSIKLKIPIRERMHTPLVHWDQVDMEYLYDWDDKGPKHEYLFDLLLPLPSHCERLIKNKDKYNDCLKNNRSTDSNQKNNLFAWIPLDFLP